jgi:inward rectifier potassium channel
MSPQTLPAHLLMTLEAFAGLLSYALATGLLFARFSRPTGRIRFSPNAVIAPYRGSTALELRLIAQVEIVKVQAKLLLTRIRPDGGREFLPLRLERDLSSSCLSSGPL